MTAYVCVTNETEDTTTLFHLICTEKGLWEGPTPDCSIVMPTVIPSESKQDTKTVMAPTMTIIVAVVAVITGLLMFIATVFTVKW